MPIFDIYISIPIIMNAQDLLETTGPEIDGVEFAGGSSIVLQHDALQQMIRLSHDTGLYVVESGLLQHALAQVRSYANRQPPDCV